MVNKKRWYKGYKSKKNPKELVQIISQKVQDADLSYHIPLLRVEKGARAKREYCFFLAIESQEKGKIPQAVIDSTLLNLPYFNLSVVPGNPAFTYEQIKPMVGAAHDVHDYTNPIPYLVPEEIGFDDPFDITTPSTAESSPPDLKTLSQRYQQFLYWLSAVGCGTWESFKKACRTLEIDNPRRILRRFKLLGHIESSESGRRWSIAPTALVRANSESEKSEFILCGQQNGDLLKALDRHGLVRTIDQPKGNAPPCVRVQRSGWIDSFGALESNQSRPGVQIADAGDVALQLATILPELEQWKLGLRSVPGIVTSLHDWKRFDGHDFVACSLPQQTGMYQMWDLEGRDLSLRTLFYDSETDTWRQGDWYGLRFLALHYNDRPCIARYDITSARLAVPYSQRWPELYERALVLASGLLPSYQKTEQGLWLIYENVGQNLAARLTQKLYVTCEGGTTQCTI